MVFLAEHFCLRRLRVLHILNERNLRETKEGQMANLRQNNVKDIDSF